MELYNSSQTAKTFWDRADTYFLKRYGLSLLEIIRENPVSKTVYFGGVTGAAVRASLRSMVCVHVGADGATKDEPIFPELTDKSTSYTFTSPKGLLFATQFAQPCQVILALTQH